MYNVINYFNNHEECLKNNISIYNRILLHGQPGTGKSYLVKVIAEELELPLLSFSASFFGDKYIGESARRIRKAFEIAKALNKPIIIFIDEIDALASKRENNMHTEHRAALITLLTELQELQDNKNIFVFVATNDIKVLDPAIKDRFAGSICEIKEHTVKERGQLFKKLFKDNGVQIDKQFGERLAEVTQVTDEEKLSNRDIEYVVTTTVFNKFMDCKINPKNCNKPLCSYARQALDDIGKKCSYAYWSSPAYCDGI